MANISRWAAILVGSFTVLHWLKKLYLKWSHYRARTLHGCKPATTLSSNPWYFGLDTVYEMVVSYDAGSRNLEIFNKHEMYGRTFRTAPTGTNRIFTIDEENLKTVFGGKPEDWGVVPVRYEAFRPFISSGVLISDGNVWKHSRAISQSIIDRIYRHYSSDFANFDPAINALISRIPCDGSSFDLQPLLYQYTMDSSTENIFGERIGALRPGQAGQYGRRFLDAFIYCLKMAGERDEVPQWTYLVLDGKFRSSCRILHEYADNNIHRALDLCAKEPGNHASSVWARNITDLTEARDQILNVIAASFDTIAILLTNTFFHLARNPQCYAKLRQEVESYDDQPEINNIKTLKYLHLVLNETLRLNGPASFNSRVALRDMVLPRGGGFDGSYPVYVPKGDNVIVSAFALQRQATTFGSEPHVFRPERWENIKPRHWEFIPFSGGPRVCPGQKFALMHAAYLLFSLVRKFRAIENHDPIVEFVEEYRIATGSKHGAKIAVWS